MNKGPSSNIQTNKYWLNIVSREKEKNKDMKKTHCTNLNSVAG